MRCDKVTGLDTAARLCRLALTGGLLVLTAACGSLRPPEFDLDSLAPLASTDNLDHIHPDTALPLPALPAADEILALSPEAIRFIEARVRQRAAPRHKARQLLEALFSEDGLHLRYRYSDTLTATQTFEARGGNCLSISNLVVAAARHVGLEARFQDVSVDLSWNRVGSVYFMDRHINVLLMGMGRGVHFEVDMLPYPAQRSLRSKVLADATAFAHFYNNRAGEAMAGGQGHQALVNFRRALDTDPALGFVWANLGTLYGRHGQFAEAERVLGQALAINPDEYVALNNLAHIYRETGRAELAAPLDDRVKRIRRRNPYYLAEQAEEALRRRDLVQALEHIQASLRIQEDEYRFHLLAARIYRALVDPAQAAWHLEQARRHSPDGQPGLDAAAPGI